jgi:hypothetical protein
MSPILTLTLSASVAGLTACVWYVNLVHRRPRRIAPTVALTIVAGLVLRYALTGPEVETKGPVHEAIAIAFCYAAMLLGMVAQYGYDQAERREFTFDPAAFFMPIFASPIVFIPLLTVIGDVQSTGALASSKLMVYLIAFQNGFFWRGFFDARRAAGAAAGRSRDLPLRT